MGVWESESTQRLFGKMRIGQKEMSLDGSVQRWISPKVGSRIRVRSREDDDHGRNKLIYKVRLSERKRNMVSNMKNFCIDFLPFKRQQQRRRRRNPRRQPSWKSHQCHTWHSQVPATTVSTKAKLRALLANWWSNW